MLIHSKIFGTDRCVIIDGYHVTTIVEDERGSTTVYSIADPEGFHIQMPFGEMEKLFLDIKSRDRYSGAQQKTSTRKNFNVVIVGHHKFQLDIRTTQYEDGLISSIELSANFQVNNDAIKTTVEYVIGVEDYCRLSWNKYSGTISIGKLFDPETVRNQVEEKIKQYLSM